METGQREKSLWIPMLGLAAWSIFWVCLIQVRGGDLSESFRPALQEPVSSSALRVTEPGESGGEMLELRLLPPAERTAVVETSEETENSPQEQELPEPSEE